MAQIFKKIGVMGKPRNLGASDTIRCLFNFLRRRGCQVFVQDTLGEELDLPAESHRPQSELSSICDLIVVVGGDGSMLNAGRLLADSGVPVVGINRGKLGFLTDIAPSDLESRLGEILDGQYRRAERFLLHCRVLRHNDEVGQSTAVNDIVLFPGEIARMIEFEVSVNHQFVYTQRSDGLIIATPTGSTAYALSGGGPIMHPKLDAVVLVPMFPHTLSNRPIVLTGESTIEISISASNQSYPQISCDGQVQISVAPGDTILIEKTKKPLQLLHPTDYDYYHVLRTKLGWSSKQ